MSTLLGALINGAILSAATAAVLWIALRLAPRRALNASTRYVAWWAALIATAILPGLFFLESMRPPAVTQPAVPMPAAAAANFTDPLEDMSPTQTAPFAAAPELTKNSSPAALPRRARFRTPSFPIEIPGGTWIVWLAAAWVLASAAMLVRLAVSWVVLYRLNTRSSEPPEAFRGCAERWLAQCGSRRRGVRLASSAEIGIPAAAGPVRPAILFPARLFDAMGGAGLSLPSAGQAQACPTMDASALEQIGLHEAAHLARHDDYGLLAQRVLEALFALHPVGWWIGKRIDLEREIACDDHVLAATGQSRSYASCLTRMVELSGNRRPSPAVAAAVGRSQLVRRVETLLDRTRHTGTRLLRARLAAVVAALALLAWIGGRSPGLLAFSGPHGLPAAISRIPNMAAAALAQVQIITIPDPTRPVANVQPPSTPVRPEDLCTLEGKITNAATGEPVGKASIYIRSQGSNPGARFYSTVTDETGKFEAKGVDPGQYQIFASHSRFVTFSYWGSASKTLTLAAGQKTAGVDLTMMPRGVIAGRVVNRDGEPMASYYVTPLVYKYVDGRRVLAEAQGSPVSNDAGEYRLSNLPPGRYYIQVASRGGGQGAEQDRSATPRQEDYVTSYYPGTIDPSAATPIEVAPGQTISGVNIAVVKSHVTHVGGRAVNQSGVATRGGMVNLTSTGLAGIFGPTVNLGPEGEFEFGGIAPGAYSIDVRLLLQTGQWRYVRRAIAVGREPVENLSIAVPGAYEIPGTVRVEGDQKLDLRSLKVGLRTPWRQIFGFTVNPEPPDNSGAFRLLEINPEHYALEIQNLPGEFYIKSARFGDANALEDGVDLTRGAPAPLEVVLSGAAAGLLGSVKDADGRAAAEATVALVPQEAARQQQPLFYRSAKTDPSGNFKLTGLSPGEYKLYSWERVDGEPWVSAEFLKPLESQAKAVTLRESSSQTVELRVIPTER